MRGLWTRQQGPVLEEPGLRLRLPRTSDFEAWRALRETSRAHLKPFEPRWSVHDLTQRAFAERVRRATREAGAGQEFSFLVFMLDADSETLVGGLTLSNIRYRAACHANVGYWMGEKFAGKGYMSRAVGLLVPYSFGTLGLKRLHAACLPHNAASIAVLEKNGFLKEGVAEQYLQIDGRWQDHLLFGLTKDRFIALNNS